VDLIGGIRGEGLAREGDRGGGATNGPFILDKTKGPHKLLGKGCSFGNWKTEFRTPDEFGVFQTNKDLLMDKSPRS